MRRISVILLAVVFIICGIAACGNSAGSTGGTGEKKEYEEKAAAAAEYPTVAAAQEEREKEGQTVDFTDVILLENDLMRVELSRFYEDEVNYGYGSGPLMDKFITLKVKNKSDKKFSFNLYEAYIHDESVTMAGYDGNAGPAPGKTKTYTYSVYYNTKPEHTPLESLDDLYTLDMAVTTWIEGEDQSETWVSVSDVINGESAGAAAGASAETDVEEKAENAIVTETDYMTIEGMYADNSYSASNNENIRFLYIFYTAHTNAENLKIDSKSMNITVNDTNTYEAVRSRSQVRFLRSYYNSAYLKSVNIGDSVKFVETFEIPKAEMEPGRSIRISKSQIPDCDKIKLSTDDIVFCDSPEEIAKEVDPEGYEKEEWALEDAAGDVVSAVKNEINGYQWEVVVDSMKYEIEFREPNNYELRTSFNTSGGTYVVKNGYIICTNDIGGVIEVPYTYEDGKVKIDVMTALDFNK